MVGSSFLGREDPMTGPRGPLAISSQLMQGTGDRKPGETLAGESEACGKPALRPARRSPFRSPLDEPHGLTVNENRSRRNVASRRERRVEQIRSSSHGRAAAEGTPVHDRASADRDIVANAPAGTTQDHRTRIGLEVLADAERRRAVAVALRGALIVTPKPVWAIEPMLICCAAMGGWPWSARMELLRPSL